MNEKKLAQRCTWYVDLYDATGRFLGGVVCSWPTRTGELDEHLREHPGRRYVGEKVPR